MFKIPIIFVTFILVIFVPFLLLAQNKLNEKKIVEFGWDYPTITSLKANFIQREKTPFDGVFFAFDFDIYAAFDTIQYPDSKLQLNDLPKIQWGKFTDNFLIVRGAGHTGAHWLNDTSWLKISNSIKRISKVLALSKAKGIGFDPEYYFKDSTLNPWKYRPSWYNNLSYQEVGKYVRKRGKQFIQALQTSKPDVKILSLWLLGWVYAEQLTRPIEETAMALYPFFVEGMLEGKNNSSEIIDGNEAAYSYQNFITFIRTGINTRENQSRLISKPLQSKFKNISLAQSVYLDILYAKLPKFEKRFDKQTKEQWLRDNLYFAFKTTDKYVWFYNEKVNWWKNQVDSGVGEIINEVKNRINTELNKDAPQINGKSIIFDFKKREKSNYEGFSYDYIKSKKLLRIKLLRNDIKTLQVYKNSFLIYTIDNPAMNFDIPLKGKYKGDGNLIITSKDSKRIFSASFVN